MQTKNDVILRAAKPGKTDVTQGQASSTGMPPDQKENKAEEQTCPSINIRTRLS